MTTSPVSFHFWTLIALLLWRLFWRLNFQESIEGIESRKIFTLEIWGIGITTIIGFSGLLFYAFTIRAVFGYQEYEQWAWLDTLYGKEEIYKGEWSGFFFLYLFPLLAALIIYYLEPKDQRKYFFNVFFRRYTIIIIFSYLFFIVSALLMDLDIGRDHSELQRSREDVVLDIGRERAQKMARISTG